MRYMKILILTNSSSGLYCFRKELLEELLETKEVCVSSPKGDCFSLLENMGCQMIETEFKRHGKNFWQEIQLFFSYIKLIKKKSPDIILTYTIKPTLYGGVAAKLCGKRTIVNITGLGTAIQNPGLVKSLLIGMYRLAFKSCYCVFFQNESNVKFFENHKIVNKNTKKILIPGSGVNIEKHCFEEYPNRKDRNDIFLFIGRIMKDKGIEEFVKMAEYIKGKYPLVSFEVIGTFDGNYSNLIKKAEDEKIILYRGEQKDVHKFIKNCNALILPSYHEGMSNVLLEAAATGRPVLASNIPGCKETFDEGITGLSFEPRNVKNLCDTVEKFLELTWEEKSKMGKKAREKMEKQFNRQIVVQKYLYEINKLEVK